MTKATVCIKTTFTCVTVKQQTVYYVYAHSLNEMLKCSPLTFTERLLWRWQKFLCRTECCFYFAVAMFPQNCREPTTEFCFDLALACVHTVHAVHLFKNINFARQIAQDWKLYSLYQMILMFFLLMKYKWIWIVWAHDSWVLLLLLK